MKKKILIIIMICLLMGLGSFIVFNLAKNDNDDKDKNNGIMTVSEDIEIYLLDNMEMDEYKVEDLTFKNVKISVSDGNDSFQATMLSENARDELKLEIILYNKEDKKVDTLEFELSNIEENDERSLFCMVDSDLYDSYSFKVRVR